MAKKHSDPLATAVCSFLDEYDWAYSYNPDLGLMEFELDVKGEMNRINYFVDIDIHGFVVYGVYPIRADPDNTKMMASLSELIVRLNYNRRQCCLEMDFDDGELRVRSYVDCDGVDYLKHVIENSIITTGVMYLYCAPGLLDIIFRDGDAASAFDACICS